VFLGLLASEACLHDLLLARAAERCWPAEEAFQVARSIREVLTSIQEIVPCAHRISALLKAIHTDPHDTTARTHPLTGYAEFVASMMMDWCKATLDTLGIPGAITRGRDPFNYEVKFDLTMELQTDDEGLWPTKQALLFIEQRDARLRRYLRFMAKLQKAPSDEAIRKRIDEMLGAAADIYAKKTGQGRADGPSGLEKWLAVTRDVTLH
jgi:hypothetical protein